MTCGDGRLEAAISPKDREKKNHIIFYHDNSSGPDIEERVVNSIKEKGWELLPHPPYSPMEASTDYHVNRSISNGQQGKVFENLDDLVADVKAWIALKNREFFRCRIDLLPHKWEPAIEANGDYPLED